MFRWGAVFAGSLVATALWLLLQTLGTGIGLSAIDASHPASLRGAGIGTGIWSLIAPLIALFVGGLIAGRFATTFSRGNGALHGLVVWALSTIVGVLAVVSFVSMVAGGAVSLTKAAAGPVANATQQVIGNAGISFDDLLDPINARLQQQGKPPVTADQLKAATKDVVNRAATGQPIDREALVTSLEQNTQMSRQDAEDVANQIQQRYRGASEKLSQAGGQAKTTALEAAEAGGKGLAYAGLGMLVALGASVLGGLLGVRRRSYDADDRNRTIRTQVPPPPIVTTTEPQRMP